MGERAARVSNLVVREPTEFRRRLNLADRSAETGAWEFAQTGMGVEASPTDGNEEVAISTSVVAAQPGESVRRNRSAESSTNEGNHIAV